MGLVRAGLPDSARAVAVRSRGNPQIDPYSELVENEAKFRVLVGDKADAIKLLTKLWANNPQAREFAKNDDSWWYAGIRDDPAFKALVGR
jgi:hypothetical protein